MKKLLSIVLIIMLLSTNAVFADNTSSDSYDTAPRYSTLLSVYPLFKLVDNKATCSITATVNSSSGIDHAVIAAKIKKSNGTVVKSFEQKVLVNLGKIAWNNSYNLTTKGSYYMQYTIKSYKGTTLKETISGKTSTKTY